MHTPLPDPCSCMNERGMSAGNSCVRVIPLWLAGIDLKSGPGAEVRKWLKLVDDQVGTLARTGVGCAPSTLKAATPKQAKRTKLHIQASHEPIKVARINSRVMVVPTLPRSQQDSPH